jgi:hypothetical protein
MEKDTAGLAEETVVEILKGINLDELTKVAQMPDIVKRNKTELTPIITTAVHCIINGPVGVNKVTNFPTMKNAISITSLFSPEKISNGAWRKFCTFLEPLVKVNESYKKGAMFRRYQDTWPSCDSKLIAKPKR